MPAPGDHESETVDPLTLLERPVGGGGADCATSTNGMVTNREEKEDWSYGAKAGTVQEFLEHQLTPTADCSKQTDARTT